LAVLSRYVTFHVTILRAKQAFQTTSRLTVLEALLTLVFCGLATWWFGLVGLYAGTVGVVIASLVYVASRRAVTLRWAWDFREIRRLTVIGAPILLAGTVSSLFRSLDKLMILGYLSDREFQLGCYSMALMVTAQLYGLGNMLAMVMAPRYGEKFGQSGDRQEVARLAARSTEIMAALLVLPAAMAVVLAVPVLGRLLPDYGSGLVPLVWLIPGVVALSLTLPASQYLVAVNCQSQALLAVVCATALAAVGNHCALVWGYGLEGVAVATTIAYVAYFVMTFAISLWPRLAWCDRLRYLATALFLVVPTLGASILCQGVWSRGRNPWTSVALQGLLVFTVWILTTSTAWRCCRWRDALREEG
jgi:O-antigen/teichoic acid export membrane protein